MISKIQLGWNSKLARSAAAMLVLGILVTPFTNCGNYQSPQTSADSTSAVSCTTSNCISPSADNLKVTPHLGNGEYGVTAGLSEFNLGGDCNEAGYSNNVIHWELFLNGQKVRDSSMPVVGGTANAEGKCINGRYLTYVFLGPVPGDSVDRTGLKIGVGNNTSAYDLYVEVYGIDNGTPVHSSSGRTRIPLSALN